MAQNTPGQQLFDLLVTRGFDPEMLDSSGKAAPSAEDAEIYSFEFISSGGTNHGTVVVMLGDDKQLELFSGDNVGRGMDSEDKTEWYEFQHQLKNFATKNFMTFGSQNINRLKYSMQGQAALKEGLYESWNGTKNVSWNGGPDSVRLMIRHKRPMGVNEARFRQVESLFLETAEGERYKLPFRNLAGGRAMVEHVRQGGRPYDMRGQHIANMVEELNVLSRFRRASQGRVFEGDTANLVSQATAYHSDVSRALKGLASARGYNTYFESWNPADMTEQELIIEDIKTLFVQETIDSRIEQALPILARIQQQGTAMKEANIFEAWANTLLEGTWATPDTPEEQQELIALLSKELPVGADATNATEQLYSLVGDDSLFDQLQDLAEQDPNADCRSLVIARIKEMSDKGFDDFDTVLDALKSTQLAPPTVAPEAPAAPAEVPPAPVAEQDDEEYSVDGGMNNELLSRLQELAGMPHSGPDMTETYRVPDTEDRRRFIRHNIWTVMDSDEEVMQYPVEGNPFFSAKKLMRKLDDEGYDFTHVISPEGRITYSPQHDPRHLKNFPDNQVDEGQEDSPVASAITRRILLQRSDLLSKYGPEKVMAAIDDVADFVGDTDEIGSSDVSGWIKQVEQSLAGMGESLKEELQADDGEYYESADDFFGQFEAESFDNEETSPDGMEVRGYIDGVNVMVWRYDDESMTSGYGYYDDSAMSEEVAVTTGNPPLEETTALQGQYGHSGKLQKFNEVEQDIVARLRELSGMIRPA
jgi:hypothetical protein